MIKIFIENTNSNADEMLQAIKNNSDLNCFLSDSFSNTDCDGRAWLLPGGECLDFGSELLHTGALYEILMYMGEDWILKYWSSKEELEEVLETYEGDLTPFKKFIYDFNLIRIEGEEYGNAFELGFDISGKPTAMQRAFIEKTLIEYLDEYGKLEVYTNKIIKNTRYSHITVLDDSDIKKVLGAINKLSL